VTMFIIGVCVGFFSLIIHLLATKVRLANAKRKLAQKTKELAQLQSSAIASIDKQ